MGGQRPWLKFELKIPGWEVDYDPDNVFRLEDKPYIPRLRPGIRLSLDTGLPVCPQGDTELLIAAVCNQRNDELITLSFHDRSDPIVRFEVCVWRHVSGEPKRNRQPIDSAYTSDMQEAMREFMTHCQLHCENPFDHIREGESNPWKQEAPKPEGFGKWA